MITRLSRRGLTALAGGVAMTAVVAAVSFAQDTGPRDLPATPPPAASQGTDQNAAPGGQNLRPFEPRERGRFNRRGDRLDRRLDFLHRSLRINASQEQLWNDFANVVRTDADATRDRFDGRRDRFRGPREGRRGDRRDDQTSVVERLEQRQQRLADRSARTERLLAALRPLYGALDADQKAAADRLLFRPGDDNDRDRGYFNRRFPSPYGRDRFGPPFARDYFYRY
jgi:hypothetical protein